MKKYSIIGLSLLAVSAITAAFAPSSKDTKATVLDGVRELSTGTVEPLDFTCREWVDEDAIEPNCSFTNTVNNGRGSSTSGVAVASNSITFTQDGPVGFTDSVSLTTALGVE